MPARPRTTILSITAAALGALLTACGSSAGTTATQPAGSTPSGASTLAAATSATPTPPTGTTPTTTAAPDPATARPSTAPATPSVATGRPAAFVADPWNRSYEFGFVWGAERSGDAVTLTFDRAGMLLGARAKAYYDAHPAEERFDYKILDDTSFTETLTVPASATLYGNQVLGPRNGSQNQRIDLARLVARSSGGDRTKVAVWVKRAGSGPVVYLAEQYLP